MLQVRYAEFVELSYLQEHGAPPSAAQLDAASSESTSTPHAPLGRGSSDTGSLVSLEKRSSLEACP